ncbi:MAG TPA: T9SS type A sorting domain-containing protein [Acidobacteriota bacterium]|nr:T9SS type A sorting domain-containing protein [Acidobacteriota bacterium]
MSIDTVTNLWNVDTLKAGETHKVYIHLTNFSSFSYNVSNGFVVYSPDGAGWSGLAGGFLPTLTKADNFDVVYSINVFDTDGSRDSVGFAGAAGADGDALFITFDDTAWTVTFTTSIEDTTKTICIDSCGFDPTNTWSWAPRPSGTKIKPDWSGPYCWTLYNVVTDVPDGAAPLPDKFALAQNYPNPFNPKTAIKFDVPYETHVKLTVFNMLGQEVITLVDEVVPPQFGKQVEWDGRSASGRTVASGVYFYKLETDSFVQTRKMALLK